MIKEIIVYKFLIDNKVAGFYILNRPKKQAIELEMLFVLPQFIGKGIGKKLLFHASDKAQKLECTTLSLLADPNAKSFYESQGFRVIDKKESSISNRFLPIMIKNLK